jgi:hypothetical protein
MTLTVGVGSGVVAAVAACLSEPPQPASTAANAQIASGGLCTFMAPNVTSG